MLPIETIISCLGHVIFGELDSLVERVVWLRVRKMSMEKQIKFVSYVFTYHTQYTIKLVKVLGGV